MILDELLTKDSQVLLFTGVDNMNFICDDAIIGIGASDEVYKFSANHYFSGYMVGENTKLVYHNHALFLTGLAIPEPTTATLSLLALAALAGRRRRQ